VRFARKFFALKTAFQVLVLGAFPENAAFVFSSLLKLLIQPFTSKASILFKVKHWTKATIDSASSNLFPQLAISID